MGDKLGKFLGDGQAIRLLLPTFKAALRALPLDATRPRPPSFPILIRDEDRGDERVWIREANEFPRFTAELPLSIPYRDYEGDEVSDANVLVLRRLEARIPRIFDVLELTARDAPRALRKLKHLCLANFSQRGARRLAGFSGLRSLQMHSNITKNISSLPMLTSLEALCIEHCRVSDLSPLSGLVQLRMLDISGSLVSVLEPLARLVSLEYLSISSCRIYDVSALAAMTKLQSLMLHENANLRDISPLASLVGVRELVLYHSKVNDTRPIACMESLEVLCLDGTGVKDISPLSGLASLHTLYLRDLALEICPACLTHDRPEAVRRALEDAPLGTQVDTGQPRGEYFFRGEAPDEGRAQLVGELRDLHQA